MNRSSQRVRSARSQHGMALLESLMALLIFSFGLLGLLGLEARVLNISGNSENRNRAAIFASELASQMWLNGSVAPATPAYTTLEGNVANQVQGGVPGGILAVVPVVGTTNAADITITWQEPSDPVGNLSTLTTRVILP